MAQRVIPLTCTIPAKTPIATPVHFPLVFPSADVERIDTRIPPGPSGLMGFAVNYGGSNYLPDPPGTWIIANNDYIQWPLTDAPNGGNWDVSGYNLDVIDHTVYLFFHVNNLTAVSAPIAAGMLGL